MASVLSSSASVGVGAVVFVSVASVVPTGAKIVGGPFGVAIDIDCGGNGGGKGAGPLYL